eukprot:15119336-Alexandrium_andersonii.AAC.1
MFGTIAAPIRPAANIEPGAKSPAGRGCGLKPHQRADRSSPQPGAGQASSGPSPEGAALRAGPSWADVLKLGGLELLAASVPWRR